MTAPQFDDAPPQSDQLTDYDRMHLVTYLRLLDALNEGADWREAVQIIFQINVAADPDRARYIYTSHLARAQWMTKSGYRHLLET